MPTRHHPYSTALTRKLSGSYRLRVFNGNKWGRSVVGCSGTDTEGPSIDALPAENPTSLRPFFICEETGHLAAHRREGRKDPS